MRAMQHDAFARVHWAMEQVETTPEYFFDNSKRAQTDNLVIQRTLAGAVQFTDRAGKRLVTAGQAMLFTHREPSSYGYPADATTPYRLRFIASTVSVGLRDLFDAIRRDFGAVVLMPKESEATEVFNEVYERHTRGDFRDRFHEAELLHRVLILIYREQVQGTRTNDPVEFGRYWLQDHFRSPVNLKEVAEKCDVSREHFIREFTARYGEPPGRWLRRLRLEHARIMLAASERTVEEVALSCGFAGVNAFGRAYRARYGKSPRGQ